MDPVKIAAPGKVETNCGIVRQSCSSPAAQAAAPQPTVRAADVPTLIAMARSVASEGPPVNQALVEQLRAALADGSYRIDPGKIAKAMTAFYSRP